MEVDKQKFDATLAKLLNSPPLPKSAIAPKSKPKPAPQKP
jgi:hypothetical protein